MRFEDVPAGETYHRGGPWFGIRVLSIGSGGGAIVDGVALPSSVLVSFKREIGRVVLTGPIVVALAECEADDVEAATASPTPPDLGASRLVVTYAASPDHNPISFDLAAPFDDCQGLEVWGRQPNAVGAIGWWVEEIDLGTATAPRVVGNPWGNAGGASPGTDNGSPHKTWLLWVLSNATAEAPNTTAAIGAPYRATMHAPRRIKVLPKSAGNVGGGIFECWARWTRRGA